MYTPTLCTITIHSTRCMCGNKRCRIMHQQVMHNVTIHAMKLCSEVVPFHARGFKPRWEEAINNCVLARYDFPRQAVSRHSTSRGRKCTYTQRAAGQRHWHDVNADELVQPSAFPACHMLPSAMHTKLAFSCFAAAPAVYMLPSPTFLHLLRSVASVLQT